MTYAQKEMNPAATAMANGVRVAYLDRKHTPSTTDTKVGKPKLWACISEEGPDLVVGGRETQTLALLVNKGSAGVTSGAAPALAWARRTSAYVTKLCRVGVLIGLDWEITPNRSMVRRYFLSGPVARLEGCSEAV